MYPAKILYRHGDPSALIAALEAHLPASLLMFRLLQNAAKQPSAIVMANIPENFPSTQHGGDGHDHHPFLFVALADLSHDAPCQQVSFFSTVEGPGIEDATEHKDFPAAEGCIRALLAAVGGMVPAGYRNNWGYGEKVLTFPSVHELYAPIVRKVAPFADWNTYDIGSCHRYVLYMMLDEQMAKLGYTTLGDGAPKLPAAEGGKYTWGSVDAEEMRTVEKYAKYRRSPSLLSRCENVAVFYHPDGGAKQGEMIAWIFENLDGSSISLYILKEHRLSGLGMVMTFEGMRRAYVKKGADTAGSGGGGIWWHWEIMEGTKGSERIMDVLGCSKWCRSLKFGINVDDLLAFAKDQEAEGRGFVMAKL